MRIYVTQQLHSIAGKMIEQKSEEQRKRNTTPTPDDFNVLTVILPCTAVILFGFFLVVFFLGRRFMHARQEVKAHDKKEEEFDFFS